MLLEAESRHFETAKCDCQTCLPSPFARNVAEM